MQEDTNVEIKVGDADENFLTVNVVKEHVDSNEIKQSQQRKKSYRGFIEQRPVKNTDKYLHSIQSFIKTITRFIDAYGFTQKAHPVSSEYLKKLAKSIPNLIDTKITSDRFKIPDEFNKKDIVYNMYTQTITEAVKAYFNYTTDTERVRFLTEFNLNKDQFYIPHFPKIKLPPLLSKSQFTTMLMKMLNTKPYLMGIYNTFMENNVGTVVDNKTSQCIRYGVYDEAIKQEEAYIRNTQHIKPVVIDYTTNKYKYKSPTVSKTVAAKEKYLANLKKLPIKVINLINGTEPNIQFVDEYCKYDEKTHSYMLDVKPFVSDDDYNSLPNDLKVLNVMCRHEYLQYTENGMQQLVDECFLKGKCRFCGVELNVESEITTFEIDPIAYIAMSKYIKSIRKTNLNEEYLYTTFSNNIYSVFKSVLEQKNSIAMLKQNDKMIVLVVCMLYYINSIDTATKVDSKVKTFTTLCDTLLARYGFKRDDVKGLCEEFGVIPLCESFAKIVSSNDYDGNNTYSHPLFNLFRDISIVEMNGIEQYLQKHKDFSSSQLLYLKGFKYMNHYHAIIDKLVRTLWSRDKEKQLRIDVKQQDCDPFIKLSNKTIITDNDILHYAIAAVSLCPINYYHEFDDKNVCIHCQYIKNARMKTHKEFLEKYIKNYFVLFNSMHAPENKVTGVDTSKKNEYIVAHNHFLTRFDTFDDLKTVALAAKLPSYNEYFMQKYNFDFIDKTLLAPMIKENVKHVDSMKVRMNLAKIINAYFDNMQLDEIMQSDTDTIIQIVVYMVEKQYVTIDCPARIIYEDVLKKPFDIKILA